LTHNNTVARTVDVIYVLDHDTIVEAGNHQKLLKENGVYANL